MLSLLNAKKLWRACPLGCTENMKQATANIQLKPPLCSQWVFFFRIFFPHIVGFLVSCFQPWWQLPRLCADQDVENHGFGTVTRQASSFSRTVNARIGQWRWRMTIAGPASGLLETCPSWVRNAMDRFSKLSDYSPLLSVPWGFAFPLPFLRCPWLLSSRCSASWKWTEWH